MNQPLLGQVPAGNPQGRAAAAEDTGELVLGERVADRALAIVDLRVKIFGELGEMSCCWPGSQNFTACR